MSPLVPAALILAAGFSSRMGTLKPALRVGTQALLELHVARWQAFGTHPILVILGYQAELLQTTLNLEAASVVVNPHYPEGQFTSVQAGLRALQTLEPPPEALFLTPVDCPPVPLEVLQALLEHARQPPHPAAVIPTCQGRPGHPVLLGSPAVAQALRYPPDASLKQVLSGLTGQVSRLEVGDPTILWNLNTPEDVERWQRNPQEPFPPEARPAPRAVD